MSERTHKEVEEVIIELKDTQNGYSKEQEYQLLFDSMTEMVETIELIYNKNNEPIDFYIRDLNTSFAKFLGKSKEQVINKKASSIIGVIEDHWLISFASVEKTGDPITFKNYGAEFDKYYYVTAWKVSENKVGISYTDITKSEKAEIELQMSFTQRGGLLKTLPEMDKLRAASESVAKELRQFIETANAPIFGIDSKGLVNEWNHTAEKITGFTKTEVLGGDLIKTYITEDYQIPVKAVLDDALKGKETANYEFPLFTKNGQRIMVLLNASTRRDAEGKINGVLGVGQDITIISEYKEILEYKIKTRTRELEESLARERESGLLKTSFVSTASHQFRTPLAVIQSNVGLLEMFTKSDEKIAPEKYVKVTGRIKGGIAAMTELMDDVLILGKLTSGNVHYEPEEVDLAEFFEKFSTELNLGTTDGRMLKVVTKGEPYNYSLDPKLLTYALSNLISNAFKYSVGKKAPELLIYFKLKEVVVSVTDYGMGIPKEELSNVFEPFFRANNVSEIQGTGLGLSIVKEYIEINKGLVRVTSFVGKGSTFEIKFSK